MTKLNNQNTREIAYTESKTLRNEAVASANVDFLDKIKVVQYLTNDMIMSVEQIANYYEVSKKAVETVIQRNRDEFEEDGMKVLTGEELKQFRKILTPSSCVCQNEKSQIGSKARSFTILTKRSLLRVGMIMTNCAVATKIRNYLLNLEEVSTQEQKAWAIQREVGKIDRKRLTASIQKYIPNATSKTYASYTNMVYKVLFGMTAKQIKEYKEVRKNDTPRDYLTEEELALIDECETISTALIALEFTEEYIESQLKNKYSNIKLLS